MVSSIKQLLPGGQVQFFWGDKISSCWERTKTGYGLWSKINYYKNAGILFTEKLELSQSPIVKLCNLPLMKW